MRILLGLLLCSSAFANKVSWVTFKTMVDENITTVFQKDDADNLSYRLRTRVLDVDYECSIFKQPPGNADLVDYQTNYQPNANTGG